MIVSVKCQIDKYEIEISLGDKVRVKKGCGNPNVEGEWQDGEEFIVWKIDIKQWGTFVCPNNYESIAISRIELVNK